MRYCVIPIRLDKPAGPISLACPSSLSQYQLHLHYIMPPLLPNEYHLLLRGRPNPLLFVALCDYTSIRCALTWIEHSFGRRARGILSRLSPHCHLPTHAIEPPAIAAACQLMPLASGFPQSRGTQWRCPYVTLGKRFSRGRWLPFEYLDASLAALEACGEPLLSDELMSTEQYVLPPEHRQPWQNCNTPTPSWLIL